MSQSNRAVVSQPNCALQSEIISRSRYLLVLGIAIFACTQPVYGAITFAFQATVDGPISGAVGTVPPSLPFSAAPGDSVSGRFTFEPLDVSPATETTSVEVLYPFTIVINSRRLSASQYGISVHNNIPLIDDNPLLTDTISLGSAFFVADTTPGNTGPPIEWSFLIGLIGESSILDGADIPQVPTSWEQFMYQRSLIVSFPQDASGAFGFGATLTSFSLVPEPTAPLVIVTAAALLVLAFRIDRSCAFLHWEAKNVRFSRTQSPLVFQDEDANNSGHRSIWN